MEKRRGGDAVLGEDSDRLLPSTRAFDVGRFCELLPRPVSMRAGTSAIDLCRLIAVLLVSDVLEPRAAYLGITARPRLGERSVEYC